MANIDTIEATLKKAVQGKGAVGKVIAFDVKGEGSLYIDACEAPVEIKREEVDSDVKITIAADDLAGLLDGSVNGQSLMMTGRAKFTGNPAILMRLRELLV